MTSRRSFAIGLLLLVIVAAIVRGPLHAVTFSLPVSNDDAILLLMARHVLQGEVATTLWNQPYNGALDAYLLAPFSFFFGHHLGYRLYQAVCAALLVVLAAFLAHRLAGTRAAWAAALLAAWGTPYMALMTATGPPPNFLMPLVTGLPLLAALARVDVSAEPPRSGPAFLAGLLCGLAVWNSSLAIPAFVGMAAGLVAARFQLPLRTALPAAAGFALGAMPLVVARLIGASGASVVTAASAVTAIRPRWLWGAGLRDLGLATTSLFGLRVPLVVDGPERADLPGVVVAALGFGLVAATIAGAVSSRKTLPLLGWIAALAGAFALSRRTGADELRYLYGLNLPVLTLAGVGLCRLFERSKATAAATLLLLLLPWGFGDRMLAVAWSNPRHAAQVWQVPDIAPAIAALRGAGVGSAYASLQFAGRFALESEGQVVASQAWNERIPGDPLRFRDEVDLDPAPAWVLSNTLSRGMPRAPRFRDLVRETGGAANEEAAGDFVIFRAFRPPFDEGRPVPSGEIAVTRLDGVPLPGDVLDRDPATVWRASEGLGRGSGVVVRVRTPRRLGALVMAVDLVESPLAVPWIADMAGEVVARGPARHGLQWVNGAPRAGRQALLAIPLGDRSASEVRVIFQGPGPRLTLSEVFVYGPDEPEQPRAGAEVERAGLRAARVGDWTAARLAYAEAVRLEPDRAAHHASLARAAWREKKRRFVDVEGIDDGGPDLVLPR